MSEIVPPIDYTNQPDPEWYWRHQNPSWPQHGSVTPEQLEAEQRVVSMARAQSPNPRLCKLDLVNSADFPTHLHPYQEFMDYRHDNVIGDWEAWMFWANLSDLNVPQALPPPPQPWVGWQTRAQLQPLGIAQANQLTARGNNSFVTRIEPNVIMLPAGKQMRLTFSGRATIQDVFVGPASFLPFVAAGLFPVTFNGSNRVTIAANPTDPYGEVVSDPLPQIIIAPNGLLVSGYIVNTGTAQIGEKKIETGWSARRKVGVFSKQIDKSGTDWIDIITADAVGIIKIEDYYDDLPYPPAPPFPPLSPGWYFTAVANPKLDQASTEDRTQVAHIYPVAFRLQRGATKIRIVFRGNGYLGEAAVGPVDDPNIAYVASKMVRLTFNTGNTSAYINTRLVSDPLDMDFDLTRGLIIQHYIAKQTDTTPAPPSGYSQYQQYYSTPKSGWIERHVPGNAVGAVDMSGPGWTDANYSYGIDRVELYYPGDVVP
jgi:hypothetical protein